MASVLRYFEQDTSKGLRWSNLKAVRSGATLFDSNDTPERERDSEGKPHISVMSLVGTYLQTDIVHTGYG